MLKFEAGRSVPLPLFGDCFGPFWGPVEPLVQRLSRGRTSLPAQHRTKPLGSTLSRLPSAHIHTLERASALKFKPALHRAPFWRSCWPILEPGGATGMNGQSDQPSSPAQAPGTSWRSILPAIHTHAHYRENRHENLSRQCTAPPFWCGFAPWMHGRARTSGSGNCRQIVNVYKHRCAS